jgi:SAM-dependent methyltransferase
VSSDRGLLPAAAPPVQQPVEDLVWRAIHRRACARYLPAGRWARYWAHGKLARDPVFRGLLERGDLAARARVVDIGCGQGLVASLLLACTEAHRGSGWPSSWPQAPSASSYTGIEIRRRDAARGATAVQHAARAGLRARIIRADMRQADIPDCDLVLMLDVLHYVDHASQLALLQRAHAALGLGTRDGRLLLRVGDAAQGRGFAASLWVDRLVALLRGRRLARLWGRSLAEWQALLQSLGFSVRSEPMSRGTPYANVLLIADLAPSSR